MSLTGRLEVLFGVSMLLPIRDFSQGSKRYRQAFRRESDYMIIGSGRLLYSIAGQESAIFRLPCLVELSGHPVVCRARWMVILSNSRTKSSARVRSGHQLGFGHGLKDTVYFGCSRNAILELGFL